MLSGSPKMTKRTPAPMKKGHQEETSQFISDEEGSFMHEAIKETIDHVKSTQPAYREPVANDIDFEEAILRYFKLCCEQLDTQAFSFFLHSLNSYTWFTSIATLLLKKDRMVKPFQLKN